jgi:ABC-type sugar transport system ATPase subunit
LSFLSLAGVEKTYPDGRGGGTHAVKGVDLAIDEGELVVLLGPSGCGKTTTLRMIAGLELASGGAITLAGRDVTRLSPRERDVGFVFQFYALYPHLTVAENVAFPLECAGVPRAERRRAVAAIAERLGIEDLLARKPRALSGGDQQRVALARAMVRRPKVYLMDEPLGTLDADRRLAMCELIRAQQQDLGVTTVYVTHDQEEALRLADRIVVMRDGRIEQAASGAEIYDAPATLFVAEFVGSPGMNRIAGRVAPDGRAFLPEGATAPIALPAGAPPGPAVLGVRREHLHPGPAAGAALAGTVVVDEYLGSDRCLHVEGPAGRLVVRVAPDGPSALGADLALHPAPGKVRLYDAATGARIQLR